MQSDDTLDNTHLMRFAGRFSRRIHASAKKEGIPLIYCQRDERKHEIAEQYIPTEPTFHGIFCILVGRFKSVSVGFLLPWTIQGRRKVNFVTRIRYIRLSTAVIFYLCVGAYFGTGISWRY
ncbi:MAG: hypothetical protein HRF42_15035 [Candidatus Brocadia sp.]|jgi:hypothetical protein